MKKGSDKRIAPPEEILRMFQDANGVYADEMIVQNADIKDVDQRIFNPILHSNAQFLLPYKGLGSGIPRALHFYKDIEFFSNDNPGQFKAVIKRRSPL